MTAIMKGCCWVNDAIINSPRRRRSPERKVHNTDSETLMKNLDKNVNKNTRENSKINTNENMSKEDLSNFPNLQLNTKEYNNTDGGNNNTANNTANNDLAFQTPKKKNQMFV